MSALPDLPADPAGTAVVDLEAARERLRGYAESARAASTWKAYRSDWSHFTGWCDGRGLEAMPAQPHTVLLYLDALAGEGYATSTLQRRISTISVYHRARGHVADNPTADPAFRELWSGMRRRLGTATRQVAPAVTSTIRDMIGGLDLDTTGGVRDRALLLVGFAGAFRRSEIVALDVDDLEDTDDGLRVTLRRSKTDQEGEGREVGLPYGSDPDTCPVRALRDWYAAAGIVAGPAFRAVDRWGNVADGRLSGKAVALIVKRAAEAAGLDPSDYSGHSLRSGHATAAANAGASERSIMDQTGHKSIAMVRRYIRRGSLFRNNSAAVLGL